MRKRKFLTVLLALLLCCSVMAAPAFADGTGDAPGFEWTINTAWADEMGIDPSVLEGIDLSGLDGLDLSGLGDLLSGLLSNAGGKPLTPDGNMTLVDDIGTTQSDQQFLTVTTRNGNYFYIVVDRANNGAGNVHFLNQVDESDLTALLEDESSGTPVVCSCTGKCHVGAVNTSCQICAVDMTECAGKDPEPEPDPEPSETPEPDPKPNQLGANGLLVIVLVMLTAGGGAVYFLKFRKKKPDTSGDTDLDDYDYGDEDDEDEGPEDRAPDAEDGDE